MSSKDNATVLDHKTRLMVRKRFEDHLLLLEPAAALSLLEDLQKIPYIGGREFVILVERLFTQRQAISAHEQRHDVFWDKIEAVADSMGLVKQKSISTAIGYMKNSSQEDQEKIDNFEIRFNHCSKSWWKDVAQLTVYMARFSDKPVPVRDVNRMLSDAALEHKIDYPDDFLRYCSGRALERAIVACTLYGKVVFTAKQRYEEHGFFLNECGRICKIDDGSSKPEPRESE